MKPHTASGSRKTKADPWLIAAAMAKNAIVVTNEQAVHPIPNNPLKKEPKIPDVAEAMGVRSINLREFYDASGDLIPLPYPHSADTLIVCCRRGVAVIVIICRILCCSIRVRHRHNHLACVARDIETEQTQWLPEPWLQWRDLIVCRRCCGSEAFPLAQSLKCLYDCPYVGQFRECRCGAWRRERHGSGY